MSNISGLTRLDSKTIGENEVEDLESLEVEAKIEAVTAGLSPEVITRISATTKVGRFAAAGVSGYVVGQAIKNNTAVEKVMARMEKMADDEKTSPEMLLQLADSMSKVVSAITGNLMVLVKATEINAQRSKKKTRQDNAPQRINGGNNFFGPTQINGKSSDVVPEPVAG